MALNQQNRHLDPLEPKYTFPKSEPIEYPIPKFIRDNIQVDDIDGTQPKKIMSRWFQRESMKKDDILKSWPRKQYIRKTFYDYINYRDVTHCDFHTGRMTNPLEPVYHLGYPNGEKMSVGAIDGNKPVVFSKYIIPDPMNLKVEDISGTNTGSKNKIKKFNGLNFMYTSSDIPGAQGDTYKRGIVTKRNLNPLTPKYQFLGREELKENYENNPYGKNSKLERSYELRNKNKIDDSKIKIVKEEDSKQQELKETIPTTTVNKPVKEQVMTSLTEPHEDDMFRGLPLVQDT